MAETILGMDELLKNIKKKFGGIVKVGVDPVSSKGIFSLGTPSLDYLVYHSIPQGIFIEISGKEGSGKTLLAALLAKSYIEEELKRNPTNPRKILYVDSEFTADPDWFQTATGYNMNNNIVETLYLTPQGQSMEDILSMTANFANTGEVGLVIVDSLTSMAAEHSNGKDLSQSEMMAEDARVLKSFVKRYTGVFNKQKCTFIGINGSTTNISGYGNPETTQGGTYWKRACSLRLKVKQGKYLDEYNEELNSTAGNPSGNIIEVALLKSKFCRSDRRLGITYLNYTKGLDIIQDTIETATNFGLIDDSTQGTYILKDIDTNQPLLDDKGQPLKIRGKKNVKPYFIEHKEVFRNLYNKVYELLAIKESPNHRTFEEALGIDDLQKHMGVNFKDEELEEKSENEDE